MRGTVKFFDKVKGWGFITDSDGKDVFVHWTNIVMDRFRYLDEDDIVNFDVGIGNDGRQQAINVTPILTMRMIKDSLKEDNLHIVTMEDAYGVTMYQVSDQNNVLQFSEQGMSFLELAEYAGFEVHQVSA